MDFKIFNLINQFAGEYKLVDTIGIYLAKYGLIMMAVLLLVLWFMDWGLPRKKNQYAVILGLEALILGRGVLVPIIRGFWPRVRPFVEHQATLLIEQSPLEPGFPSGHAVMTFALALPVFIYNRKAGSWLMFLAALVSIGRVFVGVHYPGDIIGGFVLALAVVLFLNYYRHIFVAPVVKFLNKSE